MTHSSDKVLTEFNPQKNKLTVAYYYTDDIEYPRLAMLFGMEEVKKGNKPEWFSFMIPKSSYTSLD